MRDLFSKFKLLARLKKRKRAVPNTLTEDLVAPGTSIGVSVSVGDDDGPGPETLPSNRHQQQPQPGVGNSTAVEIAPSGSANEANEPTSQPDTPVIPRAALEALPAKLRCQILSQISDLEDLRALVLASPVFYQQYLLDRKGLLRRALTSTLGDYLVDAYAVQRSVWLDELHDGPGPVQAEDIKLFLEKYAGMHTAPPDVILEEFIEDDLIDMAGFYHALARPLVLQCATLFRHNLDPSLQVECPSKTEQMRLLRALYRFQIYCNLFGAGTWGYRKVPPLEDGHAQRLADFFCIFRPWEIEEIDCIYTLVSDKYEQVFEAIQWDVCRDHPKFEDWRWPDTPPGAFRLDNEFMRDCLREGTVSRGLRLFHKVLRTQSHVKLVHRMQKYMVLCPGFQFETILDWTSQCNRRERYPTEGDLLEDRRERMPYRGDIEDGPPLAWVTEWRGRYSNSYGGTIPASLKKWGHVFWDRGRLVGSKGMENVLHERESLL